MIRMARWLAILVGVIALVLVAMPRFLSGDLVKQRISSQLEEITGLPVRLDGEGSISLNPFLGVSYHSVSFGTPPTSEASPLLSMERMRARLSLASAFWGTVNFTEITFVRPRLVLRVDTQGNRNWESQKGSFAQQLELPLDQRPEAVSFGLLSIEDGIVQYDNARAGIRHQITGLNGTLDWPAITSSTTVDLQGVWRGEIAALKLNAATPFELLRGGQSAVSVAFNSNPAQVTFDGMFGMNGSVDAEGDFTFETPSPSRLIDWFDRPIPASGAMGATRLSGSLIASAKGIEFPDIKVETGDHSGSGRLRLRPTANGPFISGTLAFDNFTLPDPGLLATAAKVEGQPERIDLSYLDGFGLDLRLSADAAFGAPFEMADVAAAAIIRQGRAAFEIGNASALGGNLAGSVSMQKTNGLGEFVADLSFSDVDLAQLSNIDSKRQVFLTGNGDAQLRLKSTGTSTAGLMLNLNGEGYVRAKDGTLRGINLNPVLTAARQGKRSPVPLMSGNMTYRALNIAFSIANGSAFLRGSSMEAAAFDTTFNGQLDLLRQSLALRGEMITTDSATDPAIRIPFFVGGTTDTPLFIAAPPESSKKARDAIPVQ